MDIKEKSLSEWSGGRFNKPNTLFNSPLEVLSTSGNFKSGKLIDITLITSDFKFRPQIDLLFFSEKIDSNMKVGDNLNLPYDILKRCTGKVTVLDSDYSTIGSCSVGNLFNVNMTFQYKELYVIVVYQSLTDIEMPKNSMNINIGYELGVCA